MLDARVFSALLLVACRSPSPPTPAASAAASSSSPPPPVASAPEVTVDASPPTPSVATPAVDASAKVAPDGMLLVKGGTFKMGTDEGGEGDERPAHDVTVASFWLDKTEVTQAAYDECVAANVCTAPDAEILASFAGLFRG